jgi:SAM-dependent methyltransferase
MNVGGRLARKMMRTIERARPLGSSAAYWERRYRRGDTSGAGSYGANASAKAHVINDLIAGERIRTVVEFGCGDGNQASLINADRYVGLDVSATAVALCSQRFAGDLSKSFFRYDPDRFYDGAGVFAAELALSLEVIFHLVEDEAFERYMSHLFDAATRYVLILSTDHDEYLARHVRHRTFTGWVDVRQPSWTLKQQTTTSRPYDETTGSGMFSSFYLYERTT